MNLSICEILVPMLEACSDISCQHPRLPDWFYAI